MGTYEELKNAIAAVIKNNNQGEITGDLLQETLLSMVNNLGQYATFVGVATPETNPGTPDQNVFYFAVQAGTYANFNALTLAVGEAAILTNAGGNWTSIKIGLATNEALEKKQDELVSGENIKTINNQSILGKGNIDIQGGTSGQLITNITYDELVTLRNNEQLTPGMKYRITDYETRTSQAGTTSAGNPFDIIVTALDNKNLDEKASVIHSARDINGYFAKSNLHAWNILYCLDNDTSRFGWALISGSYIGVDFSEFGAGIVSGKLNGTYELEGITYAKWDANLMGMDVYILTTSENPTIGETPIIYVLEAQEAAPMGKIISVQSSTENGKGVIYRMVDENNNDLPYDFKNIMFTRKLLNGVYDADNGIDTFVYTFSVLNDNGTIEDYSVKSSYCFNNKMELSTSLPDNVFLNVFGEDYDTSDTNELGCHSNHFGQNCLENTFGTASFSNVFGRGSFFIVAGKKFRDNQIEALCDNMVFGDSCENNIIGSGSHDNVFGNNCDNNYIGTSSLHNTFGEGCAFNDCGEFFNYNILGDSCSYNTFGDFCQNNVLAGECFWIEVGNSCDHIQIGEQGSPFYAAYIVLKTGVNYIKIISLEEASNASRVEYYTISNIKGTSSEVKEIEVSRNRDYETYVSINSLGEIKQWCPADLVNNA